MSFLPMKITVVQALVLLSSVLAYPQKSFQISSTEARQHESSQFLNLTTGDYFWYPNDKGEIVQAILSGGPPPISTMADAENNVEFWYYKNGREPGVQIRPDCGDCLGSYMRGERLVVLSHGFSSNHEGDFGNTHRSALDQRSEPINVIFVNWEKLAGAPWYETAANNVDPVGIYTARMLNYLLDQGLTTLDKIHFVGHSLGSHVGNYVAKGITRGKIGRITALDPALPLFGQRDDTQRIDPSDASFVDVIHTSMGSLLDGGLAFSDQRGHADFYPNSGKNQPGCGMDIVGACSHGRANSFFAESVINPAAFVACKCNNWDDYSGGRCLCLDQEVMGWGTPTSTRGLYYLRTNANPPFGQG